MKEILGNANNMMYQSFLKQESPYETTEDQSKSTHHLGKFKVNAATFDSSQQAFPNNELPFLSSTGQKFFTSQNKTADLRPPSQQKVLDHKRVGKSHTHNSQVPARKSMEGSLSKNIKDHHIRADDYFPRPRFIKPNNQIVSQLSSNESSIHVDINRDLVVDKNMTKEPKDNLNLLFYDFNNFKNPKPLRESSGDRCPTRDIKSRDGRPQSQQYIGPTTHNSSIEQFQDNQSSPYAVNQKF